MKITKELKYATFSYDELEKTFNIIDKEGNRIPESELPMLPHKSGEIPEAGFYNLDYVDINKMKERFGDGPYTVIDEPANNVFTIFIVVI